MYFFYQVPEGKQKEYLKVTSEVIKPYWESHGCRAYDVYHEAEGGTAFVKEMLFDDLPSMQKSMALPEADAKAKSIIDRFFSFAISVRCKPYVEKI